MRGAARAGGPSRVARLAALAARGCRLTPREGRYLLRALWLLLDVDARLRLTGFARLQEPTRSQPPTPPMDGTTEQQEIELREARCMAQAIRRASMILPRARCLYRALALQLWLRRRGAAANLLVGVRPGAQGIEAHAWVEWRGVPLDEDPSVCDVFALLEHPRQASVRQKATVASDSVRFGPEATR